MNICILQHVSFEGAGTILPFFEGSEHSVKMIHLYRGDALPSHKWPDLLIVMGGPMGVEDELDYPWLADEKAFIDGVIQSNTWVLGVCLGAQLIASVLGARVTKNSTPEIGWYGVTLSSQIKDSWLTDIFEPEFDALHWHGDTFAIPEGAKLLGSSEACTNQGFLWGDRVIGLQFHLEFTPQSTAVLAERCADELIDSTWVQSAEEMLARESAFELANARMARILAHIQAEILSEIVLHPQLSEDCIQLAETDSLWILLHKNAALPWFILVPKGKFRDLDDLSKEQRNKLFSYSDQISSLLREQFNSEKINVAALGNMVPQLHLHVIGRNVQDSCWPNPVWGNLGEVKEWDATELERVRELVHSGVMQSESS